MSGPKALIVSILMTFRTGREKPDLILSLFLGASYHVTDGSADQPDNHPMAQPMSLLLAGKPDGQALDHSAPCGAVARHVISTQGRAVGASRQAVKQHTEKITRGSTKPGRREGGMPRRKRRETEVEINSVKP